MEERHSADKCPTGQYLSGLTRQAVVLLTLNNHCLVSFVIKKVPL